MPWVYKVGVNDKVASDLYFFVYDRRPTAGSAKSCRRATQRVCQLLCFLELQDACKKRSDPSQQPGKWVGTSVDLNEGCDHGFRFESGVGEE